jgi:hypothetical protein
MQQLLPHQIEDAAFLASKSFAGNFSGMGSGKTLTALEAVQLVWDGCDEPREALRHIIIIGPPISLSMWKEEFEDHCEAPAQIIRSAKTELDLDSACFIMSYQIATKLRDVIKALTPKVLICDEAHALFKIKMDYTKQPVPSKRTEAILGSGGICEEVDHCWLLTGTPSTRYSCDLYPFLLRADLRGLQARTGGNTLSRFYLRYCVTKDKKFSSRQRVPTTIVVGNRNLEELNKWLFQGGIAVRHELADVWAQMPPITINRLQVQLDSDPELTRMLKVMEKQTLSQIQEDIGKKEEHISTLRRKLGLAKVKHSVSEIIDRIEAGVSPLLVGAWHTEVIWALHDALDIKGYDVGVIDGGVAAGVRDDCVRDFNNGTLPVLIAQIGAAGVSLNMQGGSHIICVEEDWSPALMDQFYARCHRLGQKNHVHVDIFGSDTKLDKAVHRINATKARGHKSMMNQEQVDES